VLASNTAIRLLTNRLARSVEAIMDILRIRGQDAEFDGTTLLRTIYDGHLQGLYILKDPEPRAKLYLEFVDVEWQRWKKMLRESNTPLTKSILDSHVAGDAESEKRFEAVRQTYALPDKPWKCRENWFVGNLSAIAEGEIGR